MMTRSLFFILIAMMANTNCLAQTENSTRSLVNSYLRAVGSYANAGQVILATGDRQIVNTCYGYARVQEKIEVTNETVFELASTSKMFTALAILKLEMKGQLRVTDSMSMFFPNATADKRGISIHQLLTHTSGIPGGDLVEDFQEISKQDLVAKILMLPLKAAPGTRFIYSNAGYNLLAAIIEKVSGKEYGTFLEDEIFTPAGMTHSFINGSPPLQKLKTAHAYQGTDDRGGPERQVFNSRTWGGGSVCSTAEDLWQLKKALATGNLLDTASLSRMHSVQVKIASDNNYGYGCFVYWIDGKKIVDYIGETERGFNCTFREFIDDRRTLISLSNSSQPNQRHNRWFLDAHLKNLWLDSRHFQLPPLTRKPTEAALTACSGLFKASNDDLSVVPYGDNLLIEARGQEAVCFLYQLNKEQQLKAEKVIQKLDTLMSSYKLSGNDGFRSVLDGNDASDMITERDELIQKYGRLKSYRVLGVIPDTDPLFMVASVECEFEKKTIPFFTMWNQADSSKTILDFYSIGMETRFRRVFAWQEKNKWISYDFFHDVIFKDILFVRKGVLQITDAAGSARFSRKE